MPRLFSADLATLAALWICGVLLIVPLSGLWMRYGLRPVLDAVARARQAGASRRMAALERRNAVAEARLRQLGAAVRQLQERAGREAEPWRQPR